MLRGFISQSCSFFWKAKCWREYEMNKIVQSMITVMIEKRGRQLAILQHHQHCHLDPAWLWAVPKDPKKHWEEACTTHHWLDCSLWILLLSWQVPQNLVMMITVRAVRSVRES